MTVQLQEIEHCKVIAHVELPTVLVKEKINEAVKKLRKQQVPGYRKGKAPDQAIKLKLKDKVHEIATYLLITEARDEVEYETHIKYLGQPEFQAGQLHDNTFWCDLLFHKIPEFELKQYKDFELPKPNLQNVEALVEAELEKLRWQYATSVKFSENDIVENTDLLKISIIYKNPIDETDITSLFCANTIECDKDINMQIEKVASGFNQELLGMKIDDVKRISSVGDSLTVTEFGSEDFFGRKMEFIVRLQSGQKVTPKFLDDSLAVPSGYQTFTELRAALTQKFNKLSQAQTFQYLSNQIAKRLVEGHDIQLPDWMVAGNVELITHNLKVVWTDLTPEDQQAVLERARNEAKLNLILKAIREKEPESFFSDQEVINFIRNRKMEELFKLSIKEKAEVADKYLQHLQKTNVLGSIIQSLKNDATMQWMAEHSKIIE